MKTRTGNTATHLGAHARAAAVAARDLTRGASTSAGAVVLAYHDVLADDAPSFSYAVSRSRLRQQLDVVARLGLTVVTLPELSHRHRTGQPLNGLVSIVFDDALVGVHHVALGELAARGWPATLLPVVERLGADPPWWPGSQRTMTRAELVESVAAGVTLTGHGSTHACLPCLPASALRAELTASRAELTELAGGAVAELAYPYGHHDQRVRDAAAHAGFTTGYSFLNGRVVASAPALHLPRLTMHQGVGPVRLAHQLARRAADWPQAYLDECHPHGR